MRKFLAILLIIFVCSVYIIWNRFDDGSSTDSEIKNSVSVTKVEEDMAVLEKALQDAYPGTPKEVLDAYNQVLSLQYSETMEENYLQPTTELLRMMYTKELLQLNDEAIQIQTLREEMVANEINQLYMVASTIESIAFNAENMATAIVRYDTTYGTIVRHYDIIRQEEKWKINGWEDHIE